MQKKIILILSFILFQTFSFSQYSTAWARTIGGSNWDESNCAIETMDGSIVIAGYTEGGQKNFGIDGYVVEEAKRGNRFPWIVKFSETGKEVWGRSFQDTCTHNSRYSWRDHRPKYCYAEITDLLQLPDSSFVVSGLAYNNEWLTTDMWIAKLDNEGKKEWSKKFGAGRYNEGANSVAYDPVDGGFILAGYSEFNTEQQRDGWIMKLDEQGSTVWDQVWGGKKTDDLFKIITTSEGGTISVGYSMTGGGYKSMWVIKLDAEGNYEWDDYYRYSSWDVGTAIIETFDGGFAICGYTKTESKLNFNVRVLKTDDQGNKLWDFSYGDVEWEEATDIVETFDRGFAVSAFTKDIGGQYDNFWMLYIDRDGELEWEDTYGSNGFDYATNIIETKDKGILISGSSYANEHLGWDFALLKLTRDGISDYLLPKINFVNPSDTVSTSDTASYELEVCVQSIDSIRNVQIFLNDSLIMDDVQFNYSLADSSCNARIKETLMLREGENNITVRATNVAGSTLSDIYRIFYILIFKIGHW